MTVSVNVDEVKGAATDCSLFSRTSDDMCVFRSSQRAGAARLTVNLSAVVDTLDKK